MQLPGYTIVAPAADPPTWEGLVADCMQRVAEVRKELFGQDKIGEQAGRAVHQLFAAAMLTYLWRDVRVDVMEHAMVYIPSDIADKHSLDLALMRKALSLDTSRGCEGDARDGSCHCAILPNSAMQIVLPAYRQVMRELVLRTRLLLEQGWRGAQSLSNDQRQALRRIVIESRATLRLIARRDHDTLTRRPQLGSLSRGMINLRMMLHV